MTGMDMLERAHLFTRIALLLAVSGTSGVVMGATPKTPNMFPNGLSVIPTDPGAYISVTPDAGTVLPPPGGSPTPATFANWDCIGTGSAGSLQPLPGVPNWFSHSGLNAPARPPDSEQRMNNPASAFVGITPQSLCGPLEWALHSFLWLTSPTGRDAAPGIAERVFESPLFYDLQTDGPKRFNLLQNHPGYVPHLKVRALKPRSGLIAEEQTTGGVLMAQPPRGQKYGSLVYYEMAVNDFYAYLVTAVAAKAPHVSDAFPTSQAELQPILDFAKDNKLGPAKAAAPSESVFTIELKTAWVEADMIPTGCRYITRQAVIPTYSTTDPDKWVVSGEKTATLALVGMHIVGSGGGHPEMIWATFEHVCNTPNAAFTYSETPNGSNALDNAVEPQLTRGDWLFVANGSKGPFNVERIKLSGTSLAASGNHPIGPSDTLRLFPWGNVGNAANVLNVTQVLLLNRGDSLPSEDLRTWYVLIGAVWTKDGKGPATPTAPNVTGTTALSNSTMETYIQAANGKPQNCFLCHHTKKTGQEPGTAMSHIFSAINPLPVQIGTVGANTSTAAPSPTASTTPSPTSTGRNTGVAAPVPGTTASATSQTAVSSKALTTLVASEANPAGGFKCTYTVNGIQFVRNTQRPVCPATAAVPEKIAAQMASGTGSSSTLSGGAAAASGASGPTLVSSAASATGGLECTYQYGTGTFTRHTARAQCPTTANPPANAAAIKSATAAGASIAPTPTASAQAHPGKTAKAPGVTAIALRPIKTAKNEACPVNFTIEGEITTAGADTVEYTWVSSDGRSWPTATLAFGSATTQSVTEQWVLGGRGEKLKAWIQLSVLSPNRKLSNKLPITLACAP
jgi:hypothetical protein